MNKSIIVAEDEPHLCYSITTVLEWAGYIVTAVENGEMALQKILEMAQSETPVDLLICDILMPVFTGVELLEKLNELKISILVIVITEYNEEELILRLLRLGCRDLIEKPFTCDVLLERVKRVFDETQNKFF